MKTLRLGLLVLSFAGVISPARAEPFSMSTRTFEIPESGQVTNTVLRIETHEFTFLPPARWKSVIDARAGIITWTSSDYRSVVRLSITVSTNRSGQPAQNRPEEFKHVVLQEMPAARIVEQFNCYSATGAAVAFDLERLISEKHSTALRVAFLPFPGGYVQIRLITAIEDFFDRQVDLTRFLNSFRIDPVKAE